MGKLAIQLEKILDTFTYVGTSGSDKIIWTKATRDIIALAIEKYILDRKPKERLFGEGGYYNQALKEWEDNLGGK